MARRGGGETPRERLTVVEVVVATELPRFNSRLESLERKLDRIEKLFRVYGSVALMLGTATVTHANSGDIAGLLVRVLRGVLVI